MAIEDAMGHTWMPVYNGRYEVNSSGDIRNSLTLKVLRPGLSSNGYRTVHLYDGSSPKKGKSFQIHRLIMEGFHGPSTLQVNHKDGNTSNNALTNLEYVTQSQNMRHAVDVLGHYAGERNHNAKLTDAQAEEIKVSLLSNTELAAKFSVSKWTISQIKRGKRRNAIRPQ